MLSTILSTMEYADDNHLVVIGVHLIDHDIWQTSHHQLIRSSCSAGTADVRKPADPFDAFKNAANHRIRRARPVFFNPRAYPLEIVIRRLAE